MDPAPDPAIFILDIMTPAKNMFFCFLLFDGTRTSFFKDKKLQRSHKIVGIKVFLSSFA
jgi:hypothetical protein